MKILMKMNIVKENAAAAAKSLQLCLCATP